MIHNAICVYALNVFYWNNIKNKTTGGPISLTSPPGIYAFLFSKSCKVRCARAIKAYMPVSLITLITSEDWKGGALLDLSESRGIKTPSAKEISRNYSFLKPVAQLYPTHVPYSDLNAKFF